jgi:demethylmenaquinone methyltransferase / 2-methoxy-6-polyprenyl-1,4-benzoquinol methylase
MSTPQGTSTQGGYPKAIAPPQQVQNMFDQLASRYDLLNQVISMGMHWGWKRKAVAALGLRPGDAVLDVCTGTGDNLGLLRQVVGSQGQVVGLDFSANMLAMAQQRYAQTDPALQLHQGDAMALPFADDSFEGVLISFGLRNVADRTICLAELARVVKPGGHVVNLDTTPDPWLPGFTWYFKHVVPKVGGLLAGNAPAYAYLAQSSAAFLAPKQLIPLFAQTGLQSVYAKRMGFGSVAMVVGSKAAT